MLIDGKRTFLTFHRVVPCSGFSLHKNVPNPPWRQQAKHTPFGGWGPGSTLGSLGPPRLLDPGRVKSCQLPSSHCQAGTLGSLMHLPFSLHHLSVASGRGRQGGHPGLLYLRVRPPPPFPGVTEALPSHPCGPQRPLTVAVELAPAARCRWQLKISSARRRYWVIFLFTASRRSLLGSTAVGAKGGCEGPGPAPEDRPQPPGERPSPEG